MSFEVFTARRRIGDLTSAVYENVFYDAMDLVLSKGEWQSYVDAVNGRTVTFESMNDFLTHPDGLAVSDLGLFQKCVKVVASSTAQVAGMAKRLLAQLKELGMEDALFTAEPMPEQEVGVLGGKAGPGRGYKTADNVSRLQHGNSQSYLLRRIARDQPELLDQIGKGKTYKSVRAAAIAAGFIKDVPTIRMSSPSKAAASVINRMGKEWAALMAAALTEGLCQ